MASESDQEGFAVEVSDLSFSPLPGSAPVLDQLSFQLPHGARVLCIGGNGAGKSTLLQLLSGSRMAAAGAVKVCGQDPFRGRSAAVLVTGGWRGTTDASMEERMAQMRVSELIGCDEAPEPASYFGQLFCTLDLAPLMPKFFGVLSEGERRRVELARRLREPKRVVLLDEVTSELDMLVRQALLDFLARTASTVLNVTHVFEGLAAWPSHVLQLAAGRIVRFEPFEGKEGSIFKQMVAWLSAARQDTFAPPRAPAHPRQTVAGPAVSVQGLCFSYGEGGAVRLDELSLGCSARCVLVGLNGSGKSSLLALMAGRRMDSGSGESVKILGLRPFQEHTKLDREVSILSSEWKRQVGQLAASSALTFRELAEIEVKDLAAQGFDTGLLSCRLVRLMQMLSIDPAKPVGLMSDGVLRRAQLGLKLLKPVSVLLIDEVTADLDVLARHALLQFLKEESEEGATIVYCTHIMDGLEGWATHYLHLRPGGLPGTALTAEGLVGASGARSDAALSEKVLGLLRADEGLAPAAPEAARAPPLKEEPLPPGWHNRQTGRSGAFGNYAWQEEMRPEEEWSFKSVAPEPSNRPPEPAAAVPQWTPGPPSFPVVPAAAAAAPAPGAGGYGGSTPLLDPGVNRSGTLAPRPEADHPFGPGRTNQMTTEQLVKLGLLPPER